MPTAALPELEMITIGTLSPKNQELLLANGFIGSSIKRIPIKSLIEEITEKRLDPKIFLNQLVANEISFNNVCRDQKGQAQTIAKKRARWTIGIALTTVILLAAATLLILFVPPVAAFILPLFAAIGSWSPLLTLTTFLPSVGLGIASLVARRNCKELQTKIDIKNTVLNQLENARTRLENPETSSTHSSTESLPNQPSSTLSNDKNKPIPASRTIFFDPSTSNINGIQVNDQPDRASSLPNIH